VLPLEPPDDDSYVSPTSVNVALAYRDGDTFASMLDERYVS
jgi:hypothetical protein